MLITLYEIAYGKICEKGRNMKTLISILTIIILFFIGCNELSLKPNDKLVDIDVRAILEEDDYLWIGTWGYGLIKFNKYTLGEMITYNINNSGLPSDYIYSIEIDTEGVKWIGTYKGLVRYDGSQWTVYTKDNSGLPHDHVNALAIDNDGVVWIISWTSGIRGMDWGALTKFDGEEWVIYNQKNSEIPRYSILNDIAIERSGIIWIATQSDILQEKV